MRKFLLVDLTGRGYTCEYEENELSELEKYLTDIGLYDGFEEDDETVTEWARWAQSGEEYKDRTFKIMCI